MLPFNYERREKQENIYNKDGKQVQCKTQKQEKLLTEQMYPTVFQMNEGDKTQNKMNLCNLHTISLYTLSLQQNGEGKNYIQTLDPFQEIFHWYEHNNNSETILEALQSFQRTAATSGNIFGCGIQWAKARNIAKQPNMYRTAPTAKNYSAQNVNCAKNEKPQHKYELGNLYMC